MVQTSMRRGKVNVSITQDQGESRNDAVQIDEEKVAFYLSNLNKIKKKFKIQGEVTISDLIRLPGIFGTEESTADSDKDWPKLKKVLTNALDGAHKSKQIEGSKLAKDIQSRLDAVAKAVVKIEKHIQGQSERFRVRLLDRIQTLIQDKAVDPDRLEREVAFMAERTDITEELVRMKSHLDLFKKRLQQENEVGRELDFLCQEMNREVNTMASKSQHFEISTEVVFVKGELEKIREQVQNIE